MKRRTFLKISAGSIAGLSVVRFPSSSAADSDEPFKISLAEWSLNRTIRAGKMTNLDFPRVAKRDFGIDTIEFVDQFFADKSKDMDYLKELAKRAGDEGVKMGLIMLDTNGDLGAADPTARGRAVENTYPWIDAAKFLGCATVRVNARGGGTPDELSGRVAESCAKLADYAASRGINLVIENHGGPSSDPVWLTGLMKAVNKPNFGILPDFGNFSQEVNRYDAVEMFMPFAKGVSAKSQRFSPDGEVVDTDFRRMLRLVRDAGFRGYVGVESSPGRAEEEAQAIRWTRDSLRQIREEQKRIKPIFNGHDLGGWTRIEDGEWIIENGILIGRNGQHWSTDPEKTGSWLSTERQYGDFRLELQYSINKGGNSGVFFRSSHEKNPSFTGYEMQIHDSAGRPPSKTGVGSIYAVVAPSSNTARRADEWNTVTIVAKGPKIVIEMNGEKIIDTELTRSARGYIGLQNHDTKAVVRFKNIRLEELG